MKDIKRPNYYKSECLKILEEQHDVLIDNILQNYFENINLLNSKRKEALSEEFKTLIDELLKNYSHMNQIAKSQFLKECLQCGRPLEETYFMKECRHCLILKASENKEQAEKREDS